MEVYPGKQPHNYGKIHHFVAGKTHYFDWAIFNSYVWHNQRGNHPQMAQTNPLFSGEWLNDIIQPIIIMLYGWWFLLLKVQSQGSRCFSHFHTPCLLGEFDPVAIFREKSCCGFGHGHRKFLELASGNAMWNQLQMSFKWEQHLYLDYSADVFFSVVSAWNSISSRSMRSCNPFGSLP